MLRVPQEDITRAMDIVRHRYPDQSAKLGVMGASIGGYYAALSAQLPKGQGSDFQILLYPVVSMRDHLTHLHCRECIMGEDRNPEHLGACSPLEQVSASTSPAFIVASADDPAVSPLNSILYAQELQKHQIPYSLHIYRNGGHGFGFRDSYPYKQEWLAELAAWLKSI